MEVGKREKGEWNGERAWGDMDAVSELIFFFFFKFMERKMWGGERNMERGVSEREWERERRGWISFANTWNICVDFFINSDDEPSTEIVHVLLESPPRVEIKWGTHFEELSLRDFKPLPSYVHPPKLDPFPSTSCVPFWVRKRFFRWSFHSTLIKTKR